jgi:tetratricopeptide (TPR) repeat protein
MNDQLSKARRIKNWAEINRQLISIHTQLPLSLTPQISSYITSESIRVINRQDQCESQTPRLELLYTIRYQNEDALLEDDQKDLLRDQPLLEEYGKIAKGLKLYQENQAEKAFQICQNIAKRKPSTLASKCAGLSAVSLGQTEDAIKFLRAYLGMNPRDEIVLLALAKQIGKNGDDQSALALLLNVLEINPKNSLALLNAGIAYVRLQRYLEAEKYLKSIDREAKEYGNALELLGQIEKLR